MNIFGFFQKTIMQIIRPFFGIFIKFLFTLGFKVSPNLGCRKKKKEIQQPGCENQTSKLIVITSVKTGVGWFSQKSENCPTLVFSFSCQDEDQESVWRGFYKKYTLVYLFIKYSI
jgi:hypothetical protein